MTECYRLPTPPAGASALVRRAYTEGLYAAAEHYCGTATDKRMLRRGVRRGDLHYGPDPNKPDAPGWRQWTPIAIIEEAIHD